MPRFFLPALALCLWLASWNSSIAATRVELVIDEPFTERNVPWPVTTGVPFPRGGLSSEEQCRLVDEQGREQPLQSRVAATWDAQRQNIRWLTIDFLAEPGHTYALEFGQDVTRKKFKTRLTATAKQVSTGKLLVNFDQSGPSALAAIYLDRNRDGQGTADEWIAAGPRDGEHYYVDHQGRRFSSAHDGAERQIVVESTGPVRACVRVDGHYTGPDGSRIIAYRTRYHFFAGLGLVKAIDEFKILKSTRQTRFADIGFSLQVPPADTARTVLIDKSGELGNQVQEVAWAAGTQSVSAYQETFRHFGNLECRAGIATRGAQGEQQVTDTPQLGEWLQIRTSPGAVTGSLRWMWQQFPKEWEATSDKLTLHLWSPRVGELDFGADGLKKTFGPGGDKYLLHWAGLPKNLNAISNFFYTAGQAALAKGDVDGVGINKHHEFWLHFGDAQDSANGAEYGSLAAQQPLALASPEWNCSTDVFGPLMPRNVQKKKEKEAPAETSQTPDLKKYESIVDRLFDLGRYAQDTFGDYGWWIFGSGPHYSYQWDAETQRHYADPRRFEYHTYQKETQLWWNYLRSGERKFYDWAFPSENHWVDIAVTHVPLTYECAWRGGFEQQQTLHFRPGDWSIDSSLFYVRQRDSAEAWLRGCTQFQASYHRTLETTTLAYYLTGDERYNDVVKFWRDYWSDFAGLTSGSQDVPVWIREQPWFEPTAPGEPAKTWAEMVRDYCPFTSGLRHQMTYFFSLGTLYEHTWDPQIGQVLRTCGEAYLDADHRIGVWRTQENGLPAYADAPKLAHFWVPALWKYARASGDPRMAGVFDKYFAACYAADPFYEDVGIYSNVQIGYAYYFTHDARHLRPALLELENLMPNAEPLAKPEDLGRRLYNPYAPIQCYTAVPRLMWALDRAKRDGVAIPTEAPLRPQRTAIAILKQAGKPLQARLWGYDPELKLFGPDGKPCQQGKVDTQQFASDIQPFDRVNPNFEVYLHELSLPASAPAGFYVFSPKLELAVLASAAPILVNAAEPIALDPQQTFSFLPSAGAKSLVLDSAAGARLRVTAGDDEPLPVTVQGNRLTVDLAGVAAGARIQFARTDVPRTRNDRVWFRFVELSPEDCWGSFAETDAAGTDAPASELPKYPAERVSASADNLDPEQTFVPGRFGQSLQIQPGRSLHIPDHVVQGDVLEELLNAEQGTIEFYVQRLWDERLTPVKPVTFLTNGIVAASAPFPLPLREWAHVAVEWRPLVRDPERMAVHVYIDGLDRRNYRSTWWEGYSQKPLTFSQKTKWLKELLAATQPGAGYLIDEIRVSNVARYADLSVELGGQQTFNPSRFSPPQEPFQRDEHTLLLLHLDGDLTIESANAGAAKQATLTTPETPAK